MRTLVKISSGCLLVFQIPSVKKKSAIATLRHQHGRSIGGVSGHTFLADPGDVTDVTILLQAEAQRLPPELRLVVVGAAGVEADVAAQGARVAKLRPRHAARSLCECRKGKSD